MRKAITDIAMAEAGLSDYDPPLDAYRKGRADMLADVLGMLTVEWEGWTSERDALLAKQSHAPPEMVPGALGLIGGATALRIARGKLRRLKP